MSDPSGGGGGDLVWYAAFGSNLWGPRFLTYLAGGPVVHSPVGRVQAGARDPSPPLADLPVVLTHELFFARSSRSWGGGGVAFIRPPTDPGSGGPDWSGVDGNTGAGVTLGRLWLITAGQFLDVAGQENGRHIDAWALDLDELATVGQRDVCDGWYGRVLHLGPGPANHPIVTFTCPDPHTVAPRPAHPAYLRVMGLGLMETWSLEPAAAANYLIRRTTDPFAVVPSADPTTDDVPQDEPAGLTAELTTDDLTADLARWARAAAPSQTPRPAAPPAPGSGAGGSASVAP